MSDRLAWIYEARMDLEIEKMRLDAEEIADAERCGEELYYDMSNAKTRGYTDREGSHTLMVGQWKRRKKVA